MRHFILFFTFLLCAVLISGCVQQTTSDNSKAIPSTPISSTSKSISPEIDITSNPPDGQVYLDNEYKGNTPTTIRQVSIGTHKIEVRHPGYLTWSTSFVISPENFTYSFSPPLINATREVTGTDFNGEIYLNIDERKIFTSSGGNTTITTSAPPCVGAFPVRSGGTPMRTRSETGRVYTFNENFNPNDQIIIHLFRSSGTCTSGPPYKVNVSITYRKTVKNE